jgi:hypothetical protein
VKVATFWHHTSELFAAFVYANWMSSAKNEGNYWSAWLNNRANSFNDLFATANEMGFNSIWLWVEYDPDNKIYPEPYQMVYFGTCAWENGWLKRALYFCTGHFSYAEYFN